MASKIYYKASVRGDLRKLDKATIKPLVHRLERELSKNPNIGKPLRGEFHGLFRYRAGDYRIIYTKIADGVLVVRIAHRKEVYR